eukprot:gene22826-24105_t
MFTRHIFGSSWTTVTPSDDCTLKVSGFCLSKRLFIENQDMADPSWKLSLVPASFRGAQFHVEQGSKSSGRRNVVHEYPKRDDPYTEDMGRRAKKFQIAAYVIGESYTDDRDALIDACEVEGSGTLVHPTMGMLEVICDSYSCQESRQEGGMARFEMNFVEAGTTPFTAATMGTQAVASTAADNAGAAAASAVDTAVGTWSFVAAIATTAPSGSAAGATLHQLCGILSFSAKIAIETASIGSPLLGCFK